MSPAHQLQKLLGEIPAYEAADIVGLLALAATLQSALYARILALQHQAALPDTDYLLNMDQIANHLGKSTKRVRDNMASLPFAFQGGEGTPLFLPAVWNNGLANIGRLKWLWHCPWKGCSMRGNGRVFRRGSIWWVAYYHDGHEYRESSKSRERTAAVRLLRLHLGGSRPV